MLHKWKLPSLPLFLLLASVSCSTPAPANSSDAAALLDFKAKADLNNALIFYSNKTLHFCRLVGIECAKARVVRLVIQDLDLGGVFAPDTLTRLDQLRVLSLQNLSLTGPVPDLSGLINLKTLFLDHNAFSGSLPHSFSSLHRLRTLDLSYNYLTGSLPKWLAGLNRLYYLRLEWNHFNGSIPPLNQSSLQTFNVSANNLTGVVPVTPTLLRFGPSSFYRNPGLCGEIIRIECRPNAPFFRPAAPSTVPEAPSPARPLGLRAGEGVELAQPCHKKHKRTAVIVGFSSGVFVLICSLLCFVLAVKKSRNNKQVKKADLTADDVAALHAAEAVHMEQEELEQKVKRVQGIQVVKSGSLLFCAGEAQVYSLDQLMRASAELLGRGMLGSTYKAVLDNRLIVCVKRLDASVLEGTGRDVFERHLESVGGLRHPNLVPLRAYFQAKEERLLIYDYQPNGSLFSLLHGSKSTRAKPLHWTSCLKIAEDVAQGLSYIHQAWRLVHGNLKSSNVLLGSDFEACVTDYCLSVLVTNPPQWEEENPDSAACKAPEIRHSNYTPTPKSDVYAYGILLVELLTGRPPSQHLVSVPPNEMMEWVRSVREEADHDGGGAHSEESRNKMEMLLEVAITCRSASPEQRPTMWQVLKMLQEIKETLAAHETESELMGSCPG
ncbi:probable inactive receptor kinase At5g67200 [Argentina anserina]|uniref:probable inactive receptor kinase At5g67200 n=1 Tax=Argentina anserina TaxID=57926 RepID=UPI0021768ED9|nr:probable inactive receptor kinase At5g67200 [Potentilla anserina]